MSDTAASQPAIAPADAQVLKIPGVKMSVAVGKDVVVRLPGVAHSYQGRVVGYDSYEYIILNVRLPAKARQELATGGQIILKYIHKGTVYGFKAHTLNAINSPAPLVFVQYPSVIEKIELRRETRRDVNIDGAVHTSDGQHECLVVNLSTTGCKISVRAKARDSIAATVVNDTMVLSFSLGEDGVLKLPMVVKNIKREKGIITMGAMFLDLLGKEEEAVRQHLEKMERLTL